MKLFNMFKTKELSSSTSGNILTVRVDKNESYHTQRNNLVRPMGTCACTSMAMALRYSGYDKDLNAIIPSDKQDEDFITNFIHTDKRVINFWKNNPQQWIKDAHTGYLKFIAGQQAEANTTFGNEIHEVMEFAINTMMGVDVDNLVTQCHIQDILFNITKGGAAVVSGVWPYKNKTHIHHVVCLAGFTTSQLDADTAASPDLIDLTKVVEIIIDDPFGDYKSIYSSDNGNDVYQPYADFISIMNEPMNKLAKRAHLIVHKV